MQEDTKESNLTWMPMARDQTVPLAALSVCYVNVNRGCDFHVEKKFDVYNNDWRNPAPKHCRSSKKTKRSVDGVIHADRLGFTFDCDTFE